MHLITDRLAKAFSGRSGFFTVPAEPRHHARHHGYPNIFSSCRLTHEIAGRAATLNVVCRSGAEQVRLHANLRRLRPSLSGMGYPIHQGSRQIIALEADTMMFCDHLQAGQVVGAIFCAPAIIRNRAMVRLTLNAGLIKSEMARIELTARQIAPIFKPWDWPIARQAARCNRAASLPAAAVRLAESKTARSCWPSRG